MEIDTKSTISPPVLRRFSLNQFLGRGNDLADVIDYIDRNWSPPEPGELADALGALRKQLDATMACARERLRLEAETAG